MAKSDILVFRACPPNQLSRYVYKRPLILTTDTYRLFHIENYQLLTTLISGNFPVFRFYRGFPYFSLNQFPTTHMNLFGINPPEITNSFTKPLHISHQIEGYLITFSVIYNLIGFLLNSDNTMAVTAGTMLFIKLLSQSYSDRYTENVRLDHMDNVKILNLLIIDYENWNIV